MIEKRYGKTTKIYTDNCIQIEKITNMHDGRHKIVKSLYEDDLKKILARYFSTSTCNIEFSKYSNTTIKCWVTFFLSDNDFEAYKKGELLL